MNGVQLNGRAYCYENTVPGCLGSVASLFDLTSAVARNRLLTEKPHRDGSPISRSRSDISRMSSPIAETVEDKMIVSDMTRSSSTNKSEGTPMKMLIAQEMSKDLESRNNSPNVVAKLMGLDAPPEQQLPDLVHGRTNLRCHLRNSYSEVLAGCWHQEDSFFDREFNSEVHQSKEQYNYKDIYENWHSSPKTNSARDVSQQKGRCNEDTIEKRMILIRQKFMDAKRLSTNENLRQTKEFHDALDVLSSNQDLFLKVLQEPTSLVSHHLYGGRSFPPSPETKRITVLRPSKMVLSDKYPASGNRSEKLVNKSPSGNQASKWGSHHGGVPQVTASWRADQSPTQATRIVVLKPSLGRFQDVKAAVPSASSSPPNFLQQTNFSGEPGDDETEEAREVAKEITQQLRENLSGHRRDETMLSSVFSNGYTGDGGSFNKSEAEFVGNLSDSEVISPPSRHSWDYINRYGSPYSCSSFGRASYSPESSVAREARKRLSERWAMMASNGANGEHRHVRRSSSTLGEMLALSDVKKSEIFEVDDPKGSNDPRLSTSCLASNTGGEVESPRSLLRSKSLPVSSTTTGQRLDVEAFGPEARKIDGLTKQTAKSSFRGKFTSLFFPRSSKKPSKEKAEKSQSQDHPLPNIAESSVPFRMPCSNSKYSGSEEGQSPDSQSVKGTLWAEMNDKSRQDLSSQQAVWSTPSENQDQPSPISVLEPPFEEDARNTTGSSDAIIPNQLAGKQMNFSLGRSNLIGKSPPIGSIARTLSWDEPCAQPATSDPLKPPLEEGWLFLVQSLLSAAGLESESQLRSNLARWHSPDRPLDPLMREKYIDLTGKEPLYDSIRRQMRSNRLLVFDSVNAALVDMTGMGSIYSTVWVHERKPGVTQTGDDLADRVWAHMKEWLWRGGWDAEEEGEEGGDYNSLAAERVVRKELVGRGWSDQVRLEIDFLGKEVEGKLLEELVEESIAVLTGKVW